MSGLIRNLSVILALCGTACSDLVATYRTDSKFLRCWEAQKISSVLYRIRIEAAIFPREGALSFSPSCPTLRLQLRFLNTQMPPGFDPFQRGRTDPFAPIGIRGLADVEVEQRERPDLMVVRVHRVVEGVVLPPAETNRILEQMNRLNTEESLRNFAKQELP